MLKAQLWICKCLVLGLIILTAQLAVASWLEHLGNMVEREVSSLAIEEQEVPSLDREEQDATLLTSHLK